ncbi:MAG: M1 family metallopeptidase, partial [Firmicutes bacterium]|nr:M1 family metallopeptidase [Candidatus Caballimonas caccae]
MKKIASIICALCFLTISIFCFSCRTSSSDRSSYNIDCTFDGESISGTEKVTFYNSTENAFSELKFNLFMNAYREGAKYSPISESDKATCYYAGSSYGNIEIVSVKSGRENLEFSICGEDENILSVKLLNEVFPNESVSVDIEFKVQFPKVISRTGITPVSINMGNFYPILCGIENGAFYECVYYSNGDPFFSDCADYNVKITLPSEYVLASSCKLKNSKKDGDNSVNEYSIENARSICFVASKDFESISDTSLGIDITYYFYKDTNPSKSLKIAVDSIKTFNELFGDYPYKTYSVVETPFNEGGMEYPALVYISSDLEREAYEEVIIHETAHQWWQTTVGNNEIKYGFLDEGLAEYSVVLFYEHNPSYNIKRETLIKSTEKTYRIYCSVFDKLYGNVDTTMLRALGEYKSEYEYVNIAYIKGCLMQEYLRVGIGDDKYFKGLKKYYKEFSFKNATPEDLMG